MSGGESEIRQPVECVITVDGTEVSEFYRFLREVRVKMSRAAATTCTMVFDSIRTESGEWPVQDAAIFVPWRSIRIDARFGSRTEEVMRGFIKEVKVEHPSDMSASRVTVTGQDESLILDREHVRRTWSTAEAPLSDGQIAEQVAADHDLGVDGEGGLTNTNLAQNGTYVKLLKERAEANGFEFFIRHGVLHFRPPRLEGSAQSTIMVYAGLATNCLGFSVDHDGHKPDAVRVIRAATTGTDNVDETVEPDMTSLGGTAAESSGMGHAPFVWDLQQPRGATTAEVRTRAQSAANENAWKLQASGELDGVLYGHVLETHATVEVDGVGETFGGLYYVDEVDHAFSLDGYRQTFKLLRNATGQRAGAGGGGDVLAAVR